MSATRRAVRQAKHNMYVEARLAVVADGNVPDRAHDFALLGDLDFLVCFLLKIEPADGGVLKSTDGVREAAVIPASFANFVNASNASSPDSRMTTRVSAPASLAIFVLFMAVTRRCAGCGGLP